ncbi:MAG TPA: T9SS type A sorting domain-containing protein [Bacteroidetes bacterium]|nr:T9SS type A sorting domain-containing protein [Bacteroidota bacterium]
MNFLRVLLLVLFVSNIAISQTFVDIENASEENTLLSQKNIPTENSFVVDLNLKKLKKDLQSAPMEKQHDNNSWANITIPFPDGDFKEVKVEEAPVFEQALYDAYPEIKTYRIIGEDDEYVTGRISVTPRGLDGFIYADGYSFFIEPLDGDTHVSYKMSLSQLQNISCGVTEDDVVQQNNAAPENLLKTSNGASLRTYRIAIASSGEFSNERGNNLATINADIATYLAALNALYERELSMTFTLIANNNNIIFFDPATDGLDPNNRTSSAQTVISGAIPAADYDIGHVFYEIPGIAGGWSTSGIAGVGVVCSNTSKARGWTGAGGNYNSSNFLGTFGHEVGHQFSARHSYYGTARNCNQRTPGNGYEPGSGNSIMSYEGSCNATSGVCIANHNITPQVNTIYFHVHSLDQIITFINGTATCNSSSATGNALPVVTVPANTTIPKGTPFTLTGNAIDADGDPLVYIWEEYDTDNLALTCPAGHPNDAATSTTAPLFRSFDPSSSGATRTFPQLSDILTNTQTMGEIMAQVGRVLHFRLTARDFKAGGGGIDYKETIVTVDGASGPFQVTTANTSTGYIQGSNQTIQWDVAGTGSGTTVNCGTVNILFSTDGGQTFPHILASATPNDGSQSVTLPNVATTQGRIKIECANNIFFDINNTDIALIGGCSADGKTISNNDPVSEIEGAAALNLSLFSGTVSTSTSGTIDASDPNTNLAVENNGGGVCTELGNSPYYELFYFSVDKDETYTFSKGAGTTLSFAILNLYENSYDPSSVCMNWLASNGNLNGLVNVGNSVSHPLVKGKQYILVISGFYSAGNANSTGNYSVNMSSATTGRIFENTSFPQTGYQSTYVIVNNGSGNIVAFDPNTDLSNAGTYPAENYTIHGLEYLGGTSLAGYVGGSFASFQAALTAGTICGDLSANTVPVTIIANPLPITLTSFTAKQNQKTVLLNWQTASETDNNYFTLEHSTDGINFDFLTKVATKGNGTTEHNYRYTHQKPVVGANYYRLSQTDLDGTHKVVGVKVVTFKSDEVVVAIEPNPVRNNILNLKYTAPFKADVEIEVVDMTGRILLQDKMIANEGLNHFELPMNNLSNGVYFLRTKQAQNIQTIRFVKAR